MLKIANTETSIWHSLIALSSYHELFCQQRIPRQQVEDYFALNQYNASIRQVLSIDQTSQSAHIQLASCILFICVEVCEPLHLDHVRTVLRLTRMMQTLRGQILPVVKLVTLGYRILQAEDALDKTFRPPSADASDRRKLFSLARNFLSQVVCQIYVVSVHPDLSLAFSPFTTQCTNCSQLINDLDPGVNAIAANIIESGHGPGPRGYKFNTTADAHHVLNSIRLQFDQYSDDAIPTARANLAAWTLAFDAFKRAHPDVRLSPAERRAVALLDLRRMYFAAELSVNLFHGPVDPMLWDAHRDSFVTMLALAERAMDVQGDGEDGASGGSSSSSASVSPPPPHRLSDSASSPSSRSNSSDSDPENAYSIETRFHMNQGPVPLLYGIIQKCRTASVRKRAFELLESQYRQEGIWNSQMVLGTVYRVVALEQRGLDNPQTCEDIPYENRVHTIKVLKTGPDDYKVGFKLATEWHWEDTATILAFNSKLKSKAKS